MPVRHSTAAPAADSKETADIAERAVAEHRRIQRRKKIVVMRNNAPQILLHQLGMIANRFAE